LAGRIEVFHGHFVERNVLADAFQVESDLPGGPGDGDEGDLLALGDLEAKFAGGAGDDAGEIAAVGIIADDVVAEERGPHFRGALAGNGAVVGVKTPSIEGGSPDMELIDRELREFRGGEPKGLEKRGRLEGGRVARGRRKDEHGRALLGLGLVLGWMGRKGMRPVRMALSLYSAFGRSSGYAIRRNGTMINLADYTTGGFDRGASRAKEAAWWLVRALFFQTPLPWPSGLRVALLRAFGARIGQGVVIRSQVNITFPWRFAVADHVWIGEEVLILTLAPVEIESHCCISQRAFLCTGSHDFSKAEFSLVTRGIRVREGSWIAAGAFIAPGVEIGPGSMVTAGSVVTGNIGPGVIARGNPAMVVKEL
jgi:putative colanic acid biosynthesis acetyltransferase WcaF